MKIDGQCHCGAIAYEAEVDPKSAVICHCTDCQTISGGPFRASVAAKAENFHLLRGQPKDYIKVADSGARRAQGFCQACGSSLYSTTADNPTHYMLRLGAVRQRAEIAPVRQIWCSSALPWSEDIRSVPGVPKT